MLTVEFEATIEDGIIKVPEEYRRQLKKQVYVILLSEQEEPTGPNLLDQLLENPLEIPDFQPLSRESVHERR